LPPLHTVTFTGCEEITGTSVTDKTAADEVTPDGQALLNITLYWLPFIAAVAGFKFKTALVAPGISVNVLPPFVLTCH
jgi:hypothetical protein